MSRPVVIFAYNRPEYFQHTLKSLVAQDSEITDIYLFNDGPRSTQEEPAINNSVELFEQFFPKGKIFVSDKNLGVAFNQKRARDFIFKEHESAIFIEDDVALQPFYINMLNNLMDKLDDGQTSMVTCFGEAHRHLEVFDKYDYLVKHENREEWYDLNNDKLIHMEHIWAYGMFKKAYEGCLSLMGAYYDMLPSEYRARPHQKIYDYFSSKGIKDIVSSQDSCMSGSLIKMGYVSYSTFTANMVYLGEWGEHSRPENYRDSWSDQLVYQQEVGNHIINDSVKSQVKKYLSERYLV
jgi:glycosyltransferase involved in cell wall biosynthesis